MDNRELTLQCFYGYYCRSYASFVKDLGFMGIVQLEVAERLCAVPCTKAYGSLSVWVRSYGEPRLLRKIGPEHFTKPTWIVQPL